MNQIACHDYQTIRRLRAEVDELREELRQRDERKADREDAILAAGRLAWDLTPMQSRLVYALARREYASPARLNQAIYGENRRPGNGIIYVMLHHVRKKMTAAGITIPRLGPGGFYRLSVADRQKIRSVFEEVSG
ncbi:MAG: helix-turn-helix domain-containing protein [Robiginitomaculum sp.]|nr:helix-turn-helix domain-containing protein [Robiginitomaculum sp.]